MKYQLITLIIFITMSAPAFSRNVPEVDRISTSAGNVDMYFIGHGSLMFVVDDFVIHIDPVRTEGDYEKLPKADLILVTHDHYDHLDRDLVSDLRKPDTVMLSNHSSAEAVKWAKPMKPGDTAKTGKIAVEAVYAYNIVHERAPGQPFHPKGVGIGFIVTIGDKRFYIAGDTENIPEMKEIRDIDVAFLPMNLPYTMTPEMVAEAAGWFNPRILYPYHFGDTNTDKLKDMLKNTDIEVRIRKLN